MTDIISFLESEYYVPDSEELIKFDGGWQWQGDILRAIFDTKDDEGKRQFTAGVVSTPRQQGKSLILQCAGLYTLICGGKNLNIYSIACDQSQASLVPARAQRAVQLNPRLGSSVAITKNQLYCEANNNTWTILNSDQASAPGIVADVLLWDELGMLPEHQWNLAYLLFPSMSARREPLLLAASTVGESEEGPLYSLMEIARKGLDEHTYLFESNEILSPLTNEAQIARDKLIMPDAVWQRHYKNVIVREGSFLTDEDISSIIEPLESRPPPEHPRYVGCDYGLTHDKFAISSVAKLEDRFVLDQVFTFQGTRANPVDLNSALDTIRDVARNNYTQALIFDRWQAMSHLQQLQAEGLPAKGYNFSAGSRQQLFKNLFSIIRNRQLKVYSLHLGQCWQRGDCNTCPDPRCGYDDQEMNKHEFIQELRGLRCDSNWRVTHGRKGDDICIALGMGLIEAAQAPSGYIQQARVDYTGRGGATQHMGPAHSRERDHSFRMIDDRSGALIEVSTRGGHRFAKRITEKQLEREARIKHRRDRRDRRG